MKSLFTPEEIQILRGWAPSSVADLAQRALRDKLDDLLRILDL